MELLGGILQVLFLYFCYYAIKKHRQEKANNEKQIRL